VRTLLNRFCEEFGRIVRPLFPVLDRADAALEDSDPTLAARALLPALRETRHQLRTLATKVEEQRAYVLIFGPLKSGKSTLMNAMSAAYVSEVTSLPAYPCLVNVRHAEDREFRLTRYDGRVETLRDLGAMRMELLRAHARLAERIRATEATGETFDPGVHYPEAIRRVDVQLPAEHLQRSGTVLVDTPGLYTRMKFGYDQMTREFRDTAACAIFVVRTDNLFLEQVFEEFNQLLELFSRIFLVVNLDTSKKDLQADGSLRPSLEHEDPLRIIEAFEQLAMSAPLKEALDEGRLRIYPVDLLRAASSRLRQAEPEDDFDPFLRDLTDYLNSTDYLAAFLGDSLRRAQALHEELRSLLMAPEVGTLEAEALRMQERARRAEEELEALSTLDDHAWEETLAPLAEALREAVADKAAAATEKTAQALQGALGSWLQEDSSLAELREDRIAPLHRGYDEELSLFLRQALAQRPAESVVPTSLRATLHAAQVDFSALARESYDGLASPVPRPQPLPTFSVEQVGVRKSFWDWIFLRSRSKVTRRFFALPEGDRPITAAAKARRLGGASRDQLQEAILGAFRDAAPSRFEAILSDLHGTFRDGLIAALHRDCTARRNDAQRRLAEIRRMLEQSARVRDALSALAGAAEESGEGIRGLVEEYGETDPELLQAPETEGVNPEESRNQREIGDPT